MVAAPRVPERGDVVWITMQPAVGHEQAGRRPALVLTPDSYNGKVGLAIVCPITSHAKGYPFEVAIPDDLPVSGVILSDQARSVDWHIRDAGPICRLPGETVQTVLQTLGTLLSG